MGQLILASASSVRRQLLSQAGLSFEVKPAMVDETSLKNAIAGTEDFSPASLAIKLAETKAVSVSKLHKNRLVIGADQILEFNGKLYDKPKTSSMARQHLIALRGQTHKLLSAVSCALNGDVCWSYQETASLTMRKFSDEFLDDYLSLNENDLTQSVGAYKLEGPGVQLFDQIEGDYFVILGLPLLPLLTFLRTQKIVKV